MLVASHRFTERTTSAIARGRVDAQQGILYGAKLLGSVSRNGRRYSETAMSQAVPLYVDKKVYIDHPTKDRMGDDRSFHDFVGVIKNARHQREGIYGDIHLLKESPHYNRIVEIATNHPNAIGCSHVADGDSRISGGEEIVESIDQVFSVDLVMDPATAAGLFESVAGSGTLRSKLDKIFELLIASDCELDPDRMADMCADADTIDGSADGEQERPADYADEPGLPEQIAETFARMPRPKYFG